MTKARLLLTAILVTLPFMAIWGLGSTAIRSDVAALIASVLGLFFIAAAAALVVTFTGLDADGNLDRRGLAYRYLVWFWKKQFDHISTCRMYWSIMGGLVLATMVICFFALLPIALYYAFLSATWQAFVFLLAVLAAAAFLFGLLAAPLRFWKHPKKGLRVLARIFACVYATAIIFGTFWGADVLAAKNDISFWMALLSILSWFGLLIGVVVLFIGALVVMVLLAIFVLPAIFKSLQNTLIGKLFTTTYKKMCPVIPVTPDKAAR